MDQDTIEGYLVRAGVQYNAIDDNIWLIEDDDVNMFNIAVTLTPPIVLFRVKLMDVPEDEALADKLNRTLLELNASSLMGGAYGIEDNDVLCLVTLQSENLDYNEFQAALDSLTLAVTEHYELLKSFYHRKD